MAISDSQSGHSSPWGCCSLCLLEHFTLASMFLFGFKIPRGFVEGSPEFTVYLFLRHTEIRYQPPSTQASVSLSLRHCISFVLSPDIGITSSGFFLCLLLLSIFFTLLPPFSLSSVAFCFLSASPSPLCFWFLITCPPDSFLFRHLYLYLASFQPSWSFFFFFTTLSLVLIPFPALYLHLLEPLKCFRLECLWVEPHKWGKSIQPSFQHDVCRSIIFSPFCPRTGVCWWSTPCALCPVTAIHCQAFLQHYLLCLRPWERMTNQMWILASRTW